MDEPLKALHDTLQSAADNNSTAHIGPKEAAEGAKAIQRMVDEAFDKDAQSNASESKMEHGVLYGGVVLGHTERFADWARKGGVNFYEGGIVIKDKETD